MMGIFGIIEPFENACTGLNLVDHDDVGTTPAATAAPTSAVTTVNEEPPPMTDCFVVGNHVGSIETTCCDAINNGATSIITSTDRPATAASLASSVSCTEPCYDTVLMVWEGAGQVMGIFGIIEPFENACTDFNLVVDVEDEEIHDDGITDCSVMGLFSFDAASSCCDDLNDAVLELMTTGTADPASVATSYRCVTCQDSYSELITASVANGVVPSRIGELAIFGRK